MAFRGFVWKAFTCGILTLSVGCGAFGGAEVGEVTGKVTLDGEPLSDAEVAFVPTSGGTTSTGYTSEDGSYLLVYDAERDGAEVGEHTIRVTRIQPEAQDGETPKQYEKLPASYNTESELKIEVKSGSQTVDIPLKSDGTVPTL
ncbi:carboxypeptidase-like regulatory domain-containing protein [Thalassoroseus pseudoceratinae]|uniref:carboxypeptidase-like regulatory domain-containing protein n=1 Tax=Thalassoroseus pseudoceratinae TaxID=2713176 RepID=UPI0014221BEE|nr:carboxypeptidase-like regulatory domain-containing protein [Thalassoroseus pseudoceratinae]